MSNGFAVMVTTELTSVQQQIFKIYYNSHIFNMAKNVLYGGKTCGKNIMGTFLRHLEQAFWYLAF